jgi:hypothetical protein
MKRRRIIFICLCLLCATIAAWLWLVPHEPTYRGEGLSYWLSTYDVTRVHRPDRVDAERAFREIGSNAVPTLLKLLRTRPSAFRLKLGVLVDRLPFISVHFTPPQSLPFRALRAFEVLGPEAKSAVPSLVADLSNPDASFRVNAMNALASIHSEPATVLPAMVKFLQSTSYLERQVAAGVITAYGTNARPVVPDLIAIGRNLPPPPPVSQNPGFARPPVVPVSSLNRDNVKRDAVVLALTVTPDTMAALPQTWTSGVPGEEARQALKAIDPQAARALMEELHVRW